MKDKIGTTGRSGERRNDDKMSALIPQLSMQFDQGFVEFQRNIAQAQERSAFLGYCDQICWRGKLPLGQTEILS